MFNNIISTSFGIEDNLFFVYPEKIGWFYNLPFLLWVKIKFLFVCIEMTGNLRKFILLIDILLFKNLLS